MSNPRKFEGMPVLCWTIDDFQQFNEAIAQSRPNFDLNAYVERYRNNVYQAKIDALFNGTSIKLNLGGETEKSKIIFTDRPIGVFDFSLASNGLYRIQEFYSQKLFDEYPNKFEEFGLISGVVPPSLVNDKIVNGVRIFYYEDQDGFFECVTQQKGQAAIDQKIVNASLEFASKTKKVYISFKRNRGKVNYVEIYSLFYYATTSSTLSTDTEHAIRHIPALMVAEYLENMGIQTRVYMTRFVELDGDYNLREFYNGSKLPMYDSFGSRKIKSELFVQPIIVKEFGQQIDRSLAFMVSSADFNEVYEILARYAQEKEVTQSGSEIKLRGYPNFAQEDYYVGIERYRNKYQQYVDLGIFKSKEVLPEAMIFFHDIVINTQLKQFGNEVVEIYENQFNGNTELSDALSSTEINPFFSWWMKLSANNLKDKINIINSNELQKDIYQIRTDLEQMVSDLEAIISDVGNTVLKNFLQQSGNDILRGYKIYNSRNEFSFREYILVITNEITTYSEGDVYATSDEDIDKRDELVRDVLNIVSSMPK